MVKCYIKDYPRPQLTRQSWQNLNGAWSFRFDDNNEGVKSEWFKGFNDQTITVPFTYETKLSGIGDTMHHSCIWYSRTVDIGSDALNGRVFLHFEGSDYHTDVWVNNQHVGSHDGGYARFSFDITDYAITGINTIVVSVSDSIDMAQPRGKQRWMKDNFGCWYIQTTGIWKTVWLEYTNTAFLSSVKITPNIDKSTVEFEYLTSISACDVEAEITYNDIVITRQRTHLEGNRQTVSMNVGSTQHEWLLYTWSPENPCLYDVRFKVYYQDNLCDEAGSYFGMRKISISGNKIMLNNVPIYQRLILDQGYWPDSGLTPPSEDALIEDIDKLQELGFNGLRKHQKTEDERFLFWCDVKGMLVWSEMAATYVFNDSSVERFSKEWIEIVRQNYNHPCIITWTPFNESWGIPNIKVNETEQNFTVGIYHLTKAIDPMRPVITNDGWEHTCSDIITLHDYEQDAEKFFEKYSDEDAVLGNQTAIAGFKHAFADGWSYDGQPVIISEYGGIAIAGRGEGWGYGNRVADENDLIKRYDALTSCIKKLPYICGYCYTQVTDVEQEVNGLMDPQRNFKCDVAAIKEINIR